MFGEAFLVAELLDLAQERALLDAIEGILNSGIHIVDKPLLQVDLLSVLNRALFGVYLV